MHIRKKWILALCCVCMACIMCASTIGCAFNRVVDNAPGPNAPATKLENVTGQYDVSNLATANFNDTVTKLDTTETEISVIVDLGGKGLYDIYDKTETFASFVASSRALKYYKTLTKQQNTFISALQRSGIEYTYRGSYTSVSNAVAIRINSADFYKLGSIDGVKRVYRNEVYAIPEAIDVVTNYTPVYSTGVYDSSNIPDKGNGMLVAVLDTGLDYTHAAFQTMPDMDKTTWNHDKIASLFENNNSADNIPLHSQTLGYSVDDVFVNNKVPYAFDYADDDNDVYPSYSNHGTHVAGIIAGKDDNKIVDADKNTFIGVAPNAQLAIMKVFTDNLESKMLGGADSIDILHAIDDCAKLGVDVINMSLGSAGGFSDDLSDRYVTQVYESIQDIGISLIVAAGNEYSSGYGGGNGTNLASNPDSGTVGSPSTYEASLSVASIEGQKAPYVIGNQQTKESVAFITNSSDAYGNELDFIELLYKAMEAKDGAPISRDKPLTVPYVVIGGVGNLMNYTSSIRRQLRSTPTIALVKRGDISFADKVQYAMDNGAVACVIYNNLSGTIRMSLGDLVNPIPACSIGLEAGTNLVNNAVNGSGTLTISKDYTAGPFMSEFSSWGPTPSLRLKPEITAYGGKILSAIPGGYDQQSGTSMASPNMAGMVALMRQHVSREFGLTGAELNARVYQMLMSTTTMVNNDEGNPYSPRKQGAGLGNLQAAVETRAYITVNDKDGNVLPKTKIELLDDPKRIGEYEMEFTIHNISKDAISYAPNVYTMTETLAVDGRTVAEKAHMLEDTDVKVYVNGAPAGERITVNGNSSVTVRVTLKLGDAGRKYIEDSFKNGMYVEGFVRFENGLDASDKSINDIGVPYLAFYGDWADAPMFDYTIYEISENENDSSVELEDKIHPTASATTPLGMYEDYYIIPLGSYVYTMEDTDVAITASDERAAISIFNDDYGPIKAINEFYGVYAGLLRGAKEMQISITDTVTGETVYQNLVYNQRKSYAGGGSNVGSPVTLDIRPYDWNWSNNTQYELKLVGKLDWTRKNADGEYESELVSPEKNTFSFKFTVDYEAPSVTDYRVRFEPYTENRETKYRIYMDVDVYDNQYAMALLPCFIENKTLYSLTRYPLPIYSQKNEVTTVSFEITDYYEDYFKTGNFYLYPVDYAMNHSLYHVTADEAIDYPTEITFDTSDGRLQKTSLDLSADGTYRYQSYRLTLAPNEVYKLIQSDIQPEGTVNHKLTWASSSDSVKVYESEIFAGPQLITNVALQLMAGDRILAKIMVNVRGEAQSPPRLQSINFRPLFNGDNYVAAVGMSIPLNNNTKTQLEIECTPWYYGDVEVKWSTNNERVATVDENGLVTTHSTGSAWITAESVDRSTVKASVQVVVSSDYDVRNYRLYDYYGGEIAEIPDELNIMYLDDECFRENTTIRKVVLPKTLTEIPEGAFYGCTNLEEITIPASCLAVLNNAFQGCTKLKKVILSEFQNKVDDDITVGSLTLGIGAFYGCTSLNEIVNSKRLTTIGSGAFLGCTGLQTIDISGLRVAGEEIFSGCANLETVIMSQQTQLGRNMFYGCEKLNNVELKSKIIPYGLFAGCKSLTNVTFDASVELRSIGDMAFYNCTSLEKITLPNGEYELGADVFSGCSKLSTVEFSKDTHITSDLYTPFSSCAAFSTITVAQGNRYYSSDENGVLYNADQTKLLLVPVLAKIDLSDIYGKVKHIGASAFSGNAYLESIDLSQFLSVGEYAFAVTRLTSVTIPASWTEIPAGLFYRNDKLTTVVFDGSNVKTIGSDAFAYCSTLSNITLPDSVTEIKDGAFMNCRRLSALDLTNVKSFGSYSLAGTVITRIIAPNATTLDDFAFVSMANLITVRLGAITHMGEGIFCNIEQDAASGKVSLVGNNSIQLAEFAEGTTVIGAYAFANDSTRGHLTEVILPSTVKEIGEFAFANRVELTTVNLENVKTVGDQAFMGCTGLDLDDNALSSIETFGTASFAFTTSLKKANLSSAKEIYGSAFEHSGIESLTIPKIAFIDAFAFAETQIKTVEIPASFDSYTYDDTFYKINDAGDPEQVFGKKVLALMGGAFMHIPTLTEFTVESGNKTFFADNGVLYANVKDGKVLVQYPAGKTDKEYEVLEGTVRIGDYAFYNESHLEKITFPVSLKAIGAFAFYNDNTDGTVTREYVFKAVEAPTLESIYAVTTEYVKDNETKMVFTEYLSVFSTVYYANFGNFAALKMEEAHVLSQIKWLKDQGENVNGLTYKAPTYNYKITRPENGIGYDNPVWRAYFDPQNTTLSAYAADRTTANAIMMIQSIASAEQIREIINGIGDKEDKIAKLEEISKNSLQQARQAYNQIVDDDQKALVTEYSKLLAAEQAVRDIKAELGVPVTLIELKREGFYKLRYTEGEKFDPQSMKIIAIYDDGSQLELTPDMYTLDKPNALTLSDTSVTISYGGKSLVLGISVTANKPDIKYTVTFVGEGIADSTQTVNSGEKAVAPEQPQREGYIFKYWYVQNSSQAFDFDTPITSNITLTAAWEKASSEQPVNIGLIVGLSVGGAVLAVGVAVLVVLLLRKRKLLSKQNDTAEAVNVNNGSDAENVSDADETNKAK